jgi:uncharacterized protein (DUF3820 family)
MSLIRTRRRRKKNWMDARKGMPRGKLVVLLALTLVVIWYLGWAF